MKFENRLFIVLKDKLARNVGQELLGSYSNKDHQIVVKVGFRKFVENSPKKFPENLNLIWKFFVSFTQK